VQGCNANVGPGPAQAAPVTFSFVDGTFDLALARLDAGSEVVPVLSRLLSKAEQERAAKFRFARDRRRFVVARARLRQLLAARLGRPARSIEFAYNAHGKPELGSSGDDCVIRFNVSHAQDLAAFAFSSARAIGIDIEWVRPIDGTEDIVTRFFTPREKDLYRALDPRQRLAGFFNWWTRKEAFVKALGGGLAHSLADFDVTLAPSEPARILRVGDASGERCGWMLRDFSPAPGFVGAVVVQAHASAASGSRRMQPHPRSATAELRRRLLTDTIGQGNWR